MLAVNVRFYVKPGEDDAVEERMKVFASECIDKEPGTHLYTVIKDETEFEMAFNISNELSHVTSLHDPLPADPLSKRYLAMKPSLL